MALQSKKTSYASSSSSSPTAIEHLTSDKNYNQLCWDNSETSDESTFQLKRSNADGNVSERSDPLPKVNFVIKNGFKIADFSTKANRRSVPAICSSIADFASVVRELHVFRHWLIHCV
ncbi:hypothetical protein M514_07308 [Trichuris suis]|uniref:Uncharacterized protein n=1 Tax=Trichuris suis TaxID=68888 RepID=A0A085N3Z4_9BILA|nr:hypothetical protein M513_07308 [Trichuris suis]KFD64190.1 hypothetical protein M514_07308 [Trichuris suis]